MGTPDRSHFEDFTLNGYWWLPGQQADAVDYSTIRSDRVYELMKAAEASRHEDSAEMLQMMREGRRLRDINNLAV